MVGRPTRRALLGSLTLGGIGTGLAEIFEGGENTLSMTSQALSGDSSPVPLPERGTEAGNKWKTGLSTRVDRVIGADSSAAVVRDVDQKNHIISFETGDSLGWFETPYVPEFNVEKDIYYSADAARIDWFDRQSGKPHTLHLSVEPDESWSGADVSPDLISFSVGEFDAIVTRDSTKLVRQTGPEESVHEVGHSWFVTKIKNQLKMWTKSGEEILTVPVDSSFVFPADDGWITFAADGKHGALAVPELGDHVYLTATPAGIQLRTPNEVRWSTDVTHTDFGYVDQRVWCLTNETADSPARYLELDLTTGELQVEERLPGGFDRVDETVLMGHEDRIEAYEYTTQRTRWTVEISTPLVVDELDGAVILASTDDSGSEVQIRDTETGDPLTKHRLEGVSATQGRAESYGRWVSVPTEDMVCLVPVDQSGDPIVEPVQEAADLDIHYLGGSVQIS